MQALLLALGTVFVVRPFVQAFFMCLNTFLTRTSKLVGILSLLVLVSCVHKNASISSSRSLSKPLVILMLKSSCSFENIEAVLYRELVARFKQTGTILASILQDANQLEVNINDFFTEKKLISSDLFLAHSIVRLTIYARLRDRERNIIEEKTFFFSRLISHPRSPMMNTHFLDFEYKKMANYASSTIELFFRKYIKI